MNQHTSLDTIDGISIVGIGSLVISSFWIDGLLIATLFGGFALSIAVWRVYSGQGIEAIAWICWMVAAVVLLFDPTQHVIVLIGFIGLLVIGIYVMYLSRSVLGYTD